MLARLIVAFSLALALSNLPSTAFAAERTWLVVSDIHLDPYAPSEDPSMVGSDTNPVLFTSAITRMKAMVPHPDAVVLPGDFLAHDFGKLALRAGVKSPDAAGLDTMHAIATAFDRAFPQAQFALAAGNNDAPCGDYRSALGSAYLGGVASVWSPLVNRRGAAPDFAAEFARTGRYATVLPGGLRMLVLDTVLWSSRYLGNCGPFDRNAGDEQMQWLRDTLAATPGGMHNVVMMHVPPGYDAFSTAATRGFVPWELLHGGDNDALVAALSDPANRVAFVVAGHVHRFDVRLAGKVPIVLFGSISPVYHSNPAFYAVHVHDDGTIADIDTYAFDEWTQEWAAPRSLDAKFALDGIDAASISKLHANLETDPALRRRWEAASSGWPSNPQISWAMWGSYWRITWCAQTELTSGFASCAGIAQRAFVARYGLPLLVLGVVFLLGGLALLIVRRRRQRALLLQLGNRLR